MEGGQGVAWGDGLSAIAGVSSFNGLTGDVVYTVPEIRRPTTPVNTLPVSATTDVSLPVTLAALTGLSLFGTDVFTKFQISKVSDFSSDLTESAWLTPTDGMCTLSQLSMGAATLYYWRTLSKNNSAGY